MQLDVGRPHLVPYDTLALLLRNIHPIFGQDVRAESILIRSQTRLVIGLTSLQYT
jgi:hypothetical protein